MSYTYDQVYQSTLEYFEGDQLAATTWINKYCLRNEKGELLELNPSMMHDRLIEEILKVEDKYPSENKLTLEGLNELFSHFRLLVPGGSIMSSMGNNYKYSSLSNCFVIGTDADSYGGIMLLDQELIQLSKRRGGVGLDMSFLRPAGARVTNDARSSSGISSFMERFSNSAKEVAQEGRRGALMLSIDVRHPDAERFIDAKLEEGKVTGANISVKVSDEFMLAVKGNAHFYQVFPITEDLWEVVDFHDDPADCSRLNGKPLELNKLYQGKKPGTYVRKINARELWKKLTYNAWKRAEPGVLFWDTIIRRSPADRYEDFQTRSTNPCLVGSTLVTMSDGSKKPIKDIVPGDEVLSINPLGKLVTSKVKWSGKTKEEAEIYNLNGLRGTQDHKVFDILEGDYVCLSKAHIVRHDYNRNFNPLQELESQVPGSLGQYYCEEGLAQRYIELHGTPYEGFIWEVQTPLFKEDPLIPKINEFINYCFSNGYGRKAIAKLLGMRSTSSLVSYCRYFGLKDRVDSLDKLYETRSLYNYSKNSLSAQGLEVAKALGICIPNNNIPSQGVSNIIKFNSRFYYSRSIPELKFLLTQLYEGAEEIEIEPEYNGHKVDFKIDGKYYEIKDWFRMNRPRKTYDQNDDGKVIWLETFEDFDCDLPFSETQIRQNLILDFDTVTAYNATVVSAEKEEVREDVYDINLETNHNFFANDFLVHNCGEVPLTPYDSCRLLSINLFNVVANPFSPEANIDYNCLQKVAIAAQRVMDDVIEIEASHIEKILQKISDDPELEEIKETEYYLWKKILKKTLRGRRTGIGVTGLGDAIAALGLKYDSYDAQLIIESIMRTIAVGCYQSSYQLAAERGHFLAWSHKNDCEAEFLNQIKEAFDEDGISVDYLKGRRNIACLTCAPSGTVSIMTQTTSGLEPLFAPYYIRRRKVSDKSKATFIDKEGIGFEEFKVIHRGIVIWYFKQHPELNTLQEAEEFLKNLPESVLKEVISQSPYAGSTAQEIDFTQKVRLQAVMQKWIDHSISCTVNLPSDVSPDVVRELYELAYELGCKGLTVYRDGCRDGILITDTKKDSKPSFINVPRPEELPAEIYRFKNNNENWIAFIGFREGVPYEIFTGKVDGDVKWLPKNVQKGTIKRVDNEDNSHRYDFLYDAGYGYVNVFPAISSQFDREYWNYARFTSGMLRAGLPLEQVISILKGLSAEPHLQVWKTGVARALSQYVADGTKTGAKCEVCGADLVFEGGCQHCPNCGDSKCG